MDQIAIGNFIAKKRKEQNLTQEQLAELLGVSNKTISKWETGKCMPDYSIIEQLCKELKITLAELMNGEEDEKSVHTFDNELAVEMMKEIHELKGLKYIVPYLSLTMGGVMLCLSQIIGSGSTENFWSGFFFGFGITTMITGFADMIIRRFSPKFRKIKQKTSKGVKSK